MSTHTSHHTLRQIELLAPAKNAEIAFEAIRHGADAVYMGASSHGARSAAANSLTEMASVVEYAHKYNVRVYATVNTLIYDNELRAVEKLVNELYRIGVDALIVQDMAMLRLNIPPIALHASTQCDTRTVDKARFLASVGFSQIVLPREMNLEEIRAVHEAIPATPLEAFVHGALCVSYSGDCQASYVINGRSANRGECAQICRLPFDLVDGNGNTLVSRKHLLSLRDLNRSESLEAMIEAGVSSFKIEGRLKDVAYVKNTVAAYRRLLDEIIARHSDILARASYGESTLTFTPDLDKSFNRGYTDYFTTGSNLGSIDTPKWQGQRVGTVKRTEGTRVEVRLDTQLNNGDGLTYMDSDGEFHGFRVNRAEGNRVTLLKKEARLRPGTTLYRNNDKRWEDSMAGVTARRDMAIEIVLRPVGERDIALDISDSHGHKATVMACNVVSGEARVPQEEARRRTLEKTGGTGFVVERIEDRLGDRFVAMSVIAELRRNAIEALERDIRITYRYDYRRGEDMSVAYPSSQPLTYHDNVANHLAQSFYEQHGAEVGERALEASPMSASRTGKESVARRVMTSRYCIRRQLNRCLKTPAGREWRGPLYLVGNGCRYGLEFDCSNCRMHLMHAE